MNLMTVLGTRPEIIRLSRIVPRLDSLCRQVLVHTGQNYDPRLTDVFFEELGLRRPDHVLDCRGSFGVQVGRLLTDIDGLIGRCRPDRFLILGDTNSALSALVAKRAGIPVYHLEAGNRCFDDRVPEEVNRRVIDHASDVLLPYTERSRANLLREGIAPERIFVTGNPIREVMNWYAPQVERSDILHRLGLTAGGYFLATVHRAENVDCETRLAGILAGLERVQAAYRIPVIVSTHPRTRQRLRVPLTQPSPPGGEGRVRGAAADIRFLEPFGFFDFIALERAARAVLTDSGTVQEECAILAVANVTLRDTTERPETIECGSNVLGGTDPDAILDGVRIALESRPGGRVPDDYRIDNVSEVVAKVVLGYRGGAPVPSAHRRIPPKSQAEAEPHARTLQPL